MNVTDMMSGVMIVFLFLAVAYLVLLQSRHGSLQQQEDRLSEDLARLATKDRREKWGLEFESKELTFRFTKKEVMFAAGSAQMKPEFRVILQMFGPELLAVIKQHKSFVAQLRIVGHASSEWNSELLAGETAYFRNMRLSQERTAAVLNYMNRFGTAEYRDILDGAWALGKSSSEAKAVGTHEDRSRARRVEFQIATKKLERQAAWGAQAVPSVQL